MTPLRRYPDARPRDTHESWVHRPHGGRSAPCGPFAALGRLTVRFRYLIVVAWLVATVLSIRLLPNLSSVTNNNNNSFLPANSASVRAAQLAGPFQQGSLPTATLVVAAARSLTAADQAAINRAETAVRRVPHVVRVRDLGVSADGSVRKATVALDAQTSTTAAAKPVVAAIRATFGTVGAPAGLAFYLTGQTATGVDNQSATNSNLVLTQLLSVAFILVMLLVIYRSLLAPLVTLLPAVLVVLLSGLVIAVAHNTFGVSVSATAQFILIILVLGAGADYGIFLIFRIREEMRRGLAPHAALVTSLARVGETVTFSGGLVIGALLCLLLASLGIYQGLGPSLAIGIALMLLAGLTLTPALMAICGRGAFWPATVRAAEPRIGAWGRIADRALRRPLATLALGLALFGGLSAAVTHYALGGFGSNGTTNTTSQSALGTAVLTAHFPVAQTNPTSLLLRYPFAVWQQPTVLARADSALRADRVFQALSGPLNPNGTPLTPARLAQLHAALGPASALLPALSAGDPAGAAALQAIPAVRQAVAGAATASGATANGVVGQAASFYDISDFAPAWLDGSAAVREAGSGPGSDTCPLRRVQTGGAPEGGSSGSVGAAGLVRTIASSRTVFGTTTSSPAAVVTTVLTPPTPLTRPLTVSPSATWRPTGKRWRM